MSSSFFGENRKKKKHLLYNLELSGSFLPKGIHSPFIQVAVGQRTGSSLRNWSRGHDSLLQLGYLYSPDLELFNLYKSDLSRPHINFSFKDNMINQPRDLQFKPFWCMLQVFCPLQGPPHLWWGLGALHLGSGTCAYDHPHEFAEFSSVATVLCHFSFIVMGYARVLWFKCHISRSW